MRAITSPLVSAVRRGVVGETDVLSALIRQLFGNGEQGAFYLPQPVVNGQQVLFQDAAGTIPVTADGDPVGLMKDLSGNGLGATQQDTLLRPTYRTDGDLHWIYFDGQGAELIMPFTLTAGMSFFSGIRRDEGNLLLIYKEGSQSPWFFVAQDGSTSTAVETGLTPASSVIVDGNSLSPRTRGEAFIKTPQGVPVTVEFGEMNPEQTWEGNMGVGYYSGSFPLTGSVYSMIFAENVVNKNSPRVAVSKSIGR